MLLSNAPAKAVRPFADAGGRNVIPTASQIGITPGAASLTDGFPPLTRTPKAAGGIPPFGLDMNGILYLYGNLGRWAQAGGGYPYDSVFASDSNVGGYPKGSRVLKADGTGYWFNSVDNNVTDPESAGAFTAGWLPDFQVGASSVALTNVNVTLTTIQAGRSVITLTGTVTAALNVIFPNIVKTWVVVNQCTGAFQVTCKTVAGTGIVAANGETTVIQGDATNILANSGVITQTPTNNQFQSAGVKINRFGDRVLVGGATVSDCEFPNVVQDWLTVLQIGTGLANGVTLNSALASYTSNSPGSAFAITGASHTFYTTSPTSSNIGIVGIAFNDNTTLATHVWGGYFEAHRIGLNTQTARGIEIDTRNLFVDINPTPNQQSLTSALSIGAGAGVTAVGQQNVGTGILILGNPMAFRKGIVFGNTSIEGTDGTSGFGTAVAMASFHNLDWYNNSNLLCARISCINTADTTKSEIRFTTSGIQLLGSGTEVMFHAVQIASAVNYIQVVPAIVGSNPVLQPAGTDTNIDIQLQPKNAGLVKFGSFVGTTATSAGHILIKTADGVTRKLMVGT